MRGIVDIEWEALLDAIAQTESGNNPQAIGDRGLKNPAYGAYQMRRPAYDDVMRTRPDLRQISFEQMQRDAQAQRQLAEGYLRMLNGTYGLQDVDAILSGYNAGPGAARKGVRVPAYINKVRSQMKGR